MLTWGEIAATTCAILGIAAIALGGFTTFVGGMSDAPSDGTESVRFGCGMFAVGSVCVVIGGWRLAL